MQVGILGLVFSWVINDFWDFRELRSPFAVDIEGDKSCLLGITLESKEDLLPLRTIGCHMEKKPTQVADLGQFFIINIDLVILEGICVN